MKSKDTNAFTDLNVQIPSLLALESGRQDKAETTQGAKKKKTNEKKVLLGNLI